MRVPITGRREKMHHTTRPRAVDHKLPRLTIIAALLSAFVAPQAHAVKINTVTYNVGMRADSVDPMIGNNPNFDDGDYKFSQAGDIITNRLSLVSEFTA